jgi:hypothetical protein
MILLASLAQCLATNNKRWRRRSRRVYKKGTAVVYSWMNLYAGKCDWYVRCHTEIAKAGTSAAAPAAAIAIGIATTPECNGNN